MKTEYIKPFMCKDKGEVYINLYEENEKMGNGM